MKKFKDFTDFRLNMSLIPETVALDVMVRINDKRLFRKRTLL